MLFDEPSRKALPRTAGLEDHRTALIKGTLGAIPGIGAALSEELRCLLIRRLPAVGMSGSTIWRGVFDRWKRGWKLFFEDLAKDEQFVSTMLQAAQAGLRTHQKRSLGHPQCSVRRRL